MKKLLYLAMAAVVLALAACNPKEENKPDDPQNETIVPQQIRLADAFQEYFMSEGETAVIQYTVTPSNVNVTYTLAWASSDEKVVKVDSKGRVTAVAAGSATVTVSINEYPEVKPAVANITILAPAKVGDYIYDDGSWGENPNPDGKKVIAVVYWLGNASLFDPILEVDYPNCTHGLAMSLKQGKAEQWQKDFEEYFFGMEGVASAPLADIFKNMGNSRFCDQTSCLAEWGIKKSSYADLLMPFARRSDMWAGNMFFGIGGYTLTSVLEEYTRTDSTAARYPYQFYLNTMALVDNISAPLTTSRWYAPSVFEAALMVNTALTKPSDFNNERSDSGGNPIITHNNDNVAVMNAALAKVSGADLLPTDSKYNIASASDVFYPYDSICDFMDCGDLFECLYVCQNPQGYNVTPEQAAEIEKRWDDWLKENAGDQYQFWKEYTDTSDSNFEIADRYEAYLNIRGYEDAVTLRDKIGGASMGAALMILACQEYGNVNVATGKLNVWMFEGYDRDMSGCKGVDNPNDVVRAIIAF